jgi:hypothetical protein
MDEQFKVTAVKNCFDLRYWFHRAVLEDPARVPSIVRANPLFGKKSSITVMLEQNRPQHHHPAERPEPGGRRRLLPPDVIAREMVEDLGGRSNL